MTVEEHNRLQEVIQANKVWAEMDNIDNARHQKGTPSKIEMVNMADGAIRRMIRMINCFENFKKIDHHDQIQLMKSMLICCNLSLWHLQFVSNLILLRTNYGTFFFQKTFQ